MREHVEAPLPLEAVHPSHVIAEGVSYQAFMASYPNQRVEWVNGKVIAMPSVDQVHDALMFFLRVLFTAYLEQTATAGRVLQDPMLMRLDDTVARAPDLQVLLPASMSKLQHNEVVGAADLVVEIISKGSQRVDRVEKFAEYERGGVPEYWLIDPHHREALFFLRDSAQGVYARAELDAAGAYTSTVLPRLRLPVALLWQDPLPNIVQTLALVEEMLKEQPHA